ncbi:protein anon-73B1 [Teleopsis dalmanni]|uniref:protein anon-73B1 n=1 Tax=Teleopsis dalmanni TaxID=139649 RepID=UPI0018CE6E75|nr:protein anon-73B1 [Teleopsis dalmanni]
MYSDADSNDYLESGEVYVGDNFFAKFLVIGLFLGAMFELFIVTSTFMHPEDDQNSEHGEEIKLPESLPLRRLHRLRKLEKKKRR